MTTKYIKSGLFDSTGIELEDNHIIEFEHGVGIVFWDRITASFKVEFGCDIDMLWLYCAEGSAIRIIGNFLDEPEQDRSEAIIRLNILE